MTFAKMIVPLLTLPYFTRVLTVDGYAVVSYITSMMAYVHVILDFGFGLSATKAIVEAGEDKKRISMILGDTLVAKVILTGLSFLFCMVLCAFIPLLRENILYFSLSFVAASLTILLPDFLFRGLEQMHIITYRFLIMKGVSTFLCFVVVKGDENLLLIPLLDILGTLVSVGWTWIKIVKMQLWPIFSSIQNALRALRISVVYFSSDAATTIFGAFNTMIIGIMLSKEDIAFWSVATQLISGVQSLYTPITSGVYPYMVREQDGRLIKRLLCVFMPIVLVGTGIAFLIGDWLVVLISGEKYIAASGVLKSLLPLLIISFPSMLLGWPCLGAIRKQRQVTLSTVLAALIQILVLVLLIIWGQLTLFTVAIARIISEIVLLSSRSFFCVKYKGEFKL